LKTKRNIKLIIGIGISLSIYACVESFTTPEIVAAKSYLVVDGLLNAQPGTTQIKLLRTQNLTDTSKTKPERGAIVQIQDDAGLFYSLIETPPGTYSSYISAVDKSRKYRLYIKTTDTNEFMSEFVAAHESPPVDELTYTVESENVKVQVSTHDPANNTHYYQWRYQQTWQYTALEHTFYRLANGIVTRVPDDQYTCWKTVGTDKILVTSTDRLAQDVVSNFQVFSLPIESEQFKTRFSLLVQQTALDKPAFDYWELLRKNTQNLGTLFDPLPSKVIGNMRCLTNPDNIILGYFSASSVSEKRIFISAAEVKQLGLYDDPYKNCSRKAILFINVKACEAGQPIWPFTGDCRLPPQGANQQPVTGIPDGADFIKGYYFTSTFCMDCRLRGGTNIKPSFWQ
jgi:hypothetical protein